MYTYGKDIDIASRLLPAAYCLRPFAALYKRSWQQQAHVQITLGSPETADGRTKEDHLAPIHSAVRHMRPSTTTVPRGEVGEGWKCDSLVFVCVFLILFNMLDLFNS